MKTEKRPTPDENLPIKTENGDVPRPKPKRRRETVHKPGTIAKIEQRQAEKAIEKYKQKKLYADKRLKEKKAKVAALKDIQAVLNNDPKIGKLVEEETLEAVSEKVTEDLEIIFQPNPGPQTEFFKASEREVLYGGAAGGGKSYALIVDAIRDAWSPYHEAIVFRRHIDELRDLISKTKQLYPAMYPGAKWNKQESTWTFPSGAHVWFTYLESEDDVERYQGQAFNYVGFDELGQWTSPYCWNYMRSRLRTSQNSGLQLYMRATANPGGQGGHWVKKMFIDPAPWGQAYWATDMETGKVLCYPDKDRGQPHTKAGQPLFKRRFIPARLSDNPYLWEDGEYEKNLLSLPEVERKRLLEGDWDVVEGAAFPEFNRYLHVTEPFQIPESWIKFRACDYGYTDQSAVYWMTSDHEGRIYVYREFYSSGYTVEELAAKIQQLEMGERIRYGVLDSSLWDKRGSGPFPAEVFNGMPYRLNFRQADNSSGSRKAGKLQMHMRLRSAGEQYLQKDDGSFQAIPGRPMLQIFSNCTNLIRTLPNLPLDKHNSEDVDTDSEDHAYDAARYGIMSRPMKPSWGFFTAPPRVTARSPHTADNTFGY